MVRGRNKKQQAKKQKARAQKKRRAPFTKILKKSAFKGSSQINRMSPSEIQEWTGDTTPQFKGFVGLTLWPGHDLSNEVTESLEDDNIHDETFVPIGRTWADIFHALFIGGQLEILLIIFWISIFGVILWQDNYGNKLEDLNGILWSLSKGGIWALVLLIFYFIARFGVWLRNRS